MDGPPAWFVRLSDRLGPVPGWVIDVADWGCSFLLFWGGYALGVFFLSIVVGLGVGLGLQLVGGVP